MLSSVLIQRRVQYRKPSLGWRRDPTAQMIAWHSSGDQKSNRNTVRLGQAKTRATYAPKSLRAGGGDFCCILVFQNRDMTSKSTPSTNPTPHQDISPTSIQSYISNLANKPIPECFKIQEYSSAVCSLRHSAFCTQPSRQLIPFTPTVPISHVCYSTT